MGSVLRIIGKKLNVDQFTVGWNLEPVGITKKGDQSRRRNPNGKFIRYKESQFVFEISDATFSDLKSQIRETIEFLESNKKYIKRINADITVDVMAIDFEFNSRIDRVNVEVQNDYFPAELIKLMGKLNISLWLTQWPCIPRVKNEKCV